MDNQPHYYDNTGWWLTQPQSPADGRHTGQQQLPSQRQRQQEAGDTHKPSKPQPMPKARALALTRTLKKWLVATSLVGFLSFSGLVAFHQNENTATASQTTVTSSGASQTTSPTQVPSQQSNNFLQQQGGNTSGTNTSSQAPVSGTHTS